MGGEWPSAVQCLHRAASMAEKQAERLRAKRAEREKGWARRIARRRFMAHSVLDVNMDSDSDACKSHRKLLQESSTISTTPIIVNSLSPNRLSVVHDYRNA